MSIKQPTARVTSTGGQDYGVGKIVTMHWSNKWKEDGEVIAIQVEIKNSSIYFFQVNGVFENAHGGLFAEIVADGL